ncbi:MAG: MFS transporter [Caulobacteraceae bacterium]|nr:MFS transporter [Caulobacteraceae bacterium]
MTVGDGGGVREERLSSFNLLAFSTPAFCIGALAIAVGVYLPRYYAGHLGLGLQAVGLAFMGVRLLDTLIDPLLGFAMDRTRSRLGRYRLWLLAGATVLMLGVYNLFEAHAAVGFATLIGWLLVYYVGTSLIALSHASWASVVAGPYNERSRVFGALQLIGILGATAALLLPVLLARHDGSSGRGDVPAMGWLIVVAAPVGILLAVATTRETIPRDLAAERFTLRDYWEMVVRPDMRRIIVADFCLFLGPGWMSALYLFYFHEARGFTVADASKLLLVYVVAGIAGAILMSRLAHRLGKHKTLMLASTGYSVGLVVMTLLPRGALALTAVFMALMGFLASSFPLLDRAMVADVGDAVRLQQGRHRAGLLYAMITMVQKIAGALSIGLSFTVLGWVGYQAREGATNTPAAIHAMELVYVIGPVVFVMLGGACFIGYKLDSRRHDEIRAELARRDALASEAPILESLAGDQTTPGHLPEPI